MSFSAFTDRLTGLRAVAGRLADDGTPAQLREASGDLLQISSALGRLASLHSALATTAREVSETRAVLNGSPAPRSAGNALFATPPSSRRASSAPGSHHPELHAPSRPRPRFLERSPRNVSFATTLFYESDGPDTGRKRARTEGGAASTLDAPEVVEVLPTSAGPQADTM